MVDELNQGGMDDFEIQNSLEADAASSARRNTRNGVLSQEPFVGPTAGANPSNLRRFDSTR